MKIAYETGKANNDPALQAYKNHLDNIQNKQEN